jgi:GNAT superfamily N-acetyltransferase
MGLSTQGFKMADETADGLREMAQHRGLKLVRSRRRKPGTGDFGKFGLTDEQGKPLLGIGDHGLTANAEDIENYLRAGAASTWQQSAKIMPDSPAPRSERKRKSSKISSSLPSREPEPEPEPEPRKSNSNPRDKPAVVAPKPVDVDPELMLRPAKPGDAGALAKLLGQLSGVSLSKDDVARDIAALRKTGAGAQVAELGLLVVGCVGWCVVPMLQRGPIGRITVLIVDEDHRRQGIGTRLLARAEAALAKKGCALVEAMSDIEIRNAHNFFRTLTFDQTSYRFARKIAR